MKALTIKQPWASLIAHGIKDIENRTWKINYRGSIYLHAGASPAGKMIDLLTKEQYDQLLDHDWKSGTVKPLSAIIGEVEIVDCVINHHSIWAQTSGENDKPIYNWVLANAELYDKPILNVKGSLSLWNYDND